MTRGLADWRESILQQTLWTTAILAGIAYVPGVSAAWSQQVWSVVVADTLVWGLVLVLALWRGLAFSWRAGSFVALWFVFALLLLWTIGPVGAGIAWLLAVPVLAALFFGFAGAFIGIGAIAAVSVLFGLLLPVHQAGVLVRGPSYDLAAWLGSSGSLVFLSALLSLSIARLLRGLESSLIEQETGNRRLAEALEEREQLQEELLHNQKQSALGTLASGIAHDFNNLLVPILMASEEARDEAPAGSRQRQHLDSVINSGLRARDLVRRILAFSRTSEVNPRPLSVEPLLQEVGGLLRSSAPAGIGFEFRFDAPHAHVLADPGELHQIIMNLGTNAILAMKDQGGGTFRLALRREPDAREVIIEVCDTGPGIPAELRDRIFDPFFSTREPGSGSGTGLGLAIVDRLTTALGGSISFHSATDEGTCFVLRLAEVAGDSPAADAPGEPPDILPSIREDRPLTVLVVDDEELVRATTTMILKRHGYDVREAASGESALRQIHDDSGAVDLLVTDQAMPGMTGIKLIEQVRELVPDLPILLCSGHLDEQEYARVEELGINGVLIKPFSRRVLLEHIEALRPGDA
ncbi:MAG: response regulator [Gammaproteobacteria bacterium]|nr:response regulator [Gammaproteobacteria bacterium]